jgi:hypothetical protein
MKRGMQPKDAFGTRMLVEYSWGPRRRVWRYRGERRQTCSTQRPTSLVYTIQRYPATSNICNLAHPYVSFTHRSHRIGKLDELRDPHNYMLYADCAICLGSCKGLASARGWRLLIRLARCANGRKRVCG